MPIPVQQYQIESFDEANPFIRGMQAGNEWYGKLLQNQEQGMKNRVTPEMLQAELEYKKLMPANLRSQTGLMDKQIKWYDPLSQADINLKGSQVPLNRAHANLMGEQAKYYGRDIMSQIDLRKSEIPLNNANALLKKFQVDNPLLSLTGPASQIGALQYLNDHPGGNSSNGNGSNVSGGGTALSGQGNYADMLKDSIFGDFKRKQAATELMENRNKSYSWSNMPISYKQHNLAQARSFGYTYDQASKMFNEGKTLGDIAESKGYSKDDIDSWPLPTSAPTTANLTQQQRSNVALAGMNAIEPKLTEALKPYANRWNGVSMSQLADSVKGQNEDQQAKAIAAGAAQIELSLLRARAGGVNNIGIEMLRETLGASQNNLKTLQPTLSSSVYAKSQKYLSQYINELNKAENKAMYGIPNSYKEQLGGGQQQGSGSGDISSLSDEELLKIAGGSQE